MKCLERLLTSSPQSSQEAVHQLQNPDVEKVRTLIKEARNNCIIISTSKKGVPHIKMKLGLKSSQWECLKKLEEYIPVTHLELNEYKNLDLLYDYIKHNPNITSLHLGASSKITDEYLEKICEHLNNIDSFVLNKAPITTLPATINNRVRYLDISECSDMTTVNSTSVVEIDCPSCWGIKNLILPSAARVNSVKIFNLFSIYAPLAKDLDCSYCFALEEIEAPLLIEFNCEKAFKLRSVNIPDRELADMEPQDFLCLELTPRQQELYDYYHFSEIDPATFALGAEVKIPDVPRLALSTLNSSEIDRHALNELRQLFENMIENVNFTEVSAPYYTPIKKIDSKADNLPDYLAESCIKNGGILFTKTQLKEGIDRLFIMIESKEIAEEVKLNILTLLFDASSRWKSNEKNGKISSDSSIIRFAVTCLDGGVVNVEKDLELLHRLDLLYTYFEGINFSDKQLLGYTDPASIKNDDNIPVSEKQIGDFLVHLLIA